MAEIEWLGLSQVLSMRSCFYDRTAKILVESALLQLESQYEELTDSQFIEIIALLAQYTHHFYIEPGKMENIDRIIVSEHELNLPIVLTQDKVLTAIEKTETVDYSIKGRDQKVGVKYHSQLRGQLISNLFESTINNWEAWS